MPFVNVIHRRGPWRSFDAVEYAPLEWVDRFNPRRLPEPIGNVPTAEAEAKLHATLETQTIAAQLRSTCLRKNRRGSGWRWGLSPNLLHFEISALLGCLAV